jgi:ABC-type nitrate/sulfonate/bicarbonate transport system permease component
MLPAWITLPTNFLADLKATTGEVFGDVGVLLAVIVGLPLAFWIVRRLIGLVRIR